MSHEAYGEDYYTSPDSKVVALVEEIYAWRRQSLYAHDVLNMLIDSGLINLHDVKNIIDKDNIKQRAAKLPTSHII